MKWRYVTALVFVVMFLPLAQAATSDSNVAWCIPPECVTVLEVRTGSPINITRESANFQGNLVSLGNNSEVNVSFEWGANVSLGFETALQERTETGGFLPASPWTAARIRVFREGSGRWPEWDRRWINPLLYDGGSCAS